MLVAVGGVILLLRGDREGDAVVAPVPGDSGVRVRGALGPPGDPLRPVGTAEVDTGFRPSRGEATSARLTTWSGTLLTPDGQPASELRVHLRRRLGDNGYATRTWTDETGRFAVRAPPSWPLVELVAAKADVGWLIRELEETELGFGRDLGRLRLEPLLPISGIATGGDGIPLPWVEIRSRGRSPMGRSETRKTVTDAHGGFRVEGHFPGEYDLSLHE